MRADASVTDLAERFHMTLTGMRKHIGVLEQAELVTTEKVGRVRTCRLGARRLEEEAAWIENVPPAVGRALRRAGHGRRGTQTQGEASMVASREVSAAPTSNRTTVGTDSPSASWSSREPSTPRRGSCSRRGPRPELFRQWWVPKSSGATLLSCETGCPCRRQLPSGVRSPQGRDAHGVLRQVSRGGARMPASSGPTTKATTAPSRR